MQNITSGAYRLLTGFITILGGLFLAFLYILSVILVISFLGAMQIKSAMKEANALSVDDLMQAEHSLHRKVGRLMTDLEYKDKLYRADRNVSRAAFSLIDAAKMDKIEFSPEDMDFFYTSDTFPIGYFDQHPLFSRIVSMSDNGIGSSCDLLNDYNVSINTRSALLDSGEVEKFNQFETEQLSQIDSIKRAHPLTQFTDALRLFEAIPAMTRLISLPSEVLVLFLTMTMGLLGSVISMTWSFVRNDEYMTVRRFLVLPFIGSMSALVVFIFVKAGQLTFNSADYDVSLNVFVVSFVGIISGMLSERAYARISTVGSEFFAVDEDDPRWAIAMDAAMTTAGVSAQQLSSILSIPEQQVEEIASRKRSVRIEQQRLLAAALRIPRAELFSDLAPT